MAYSVNKLSYDILTGLREIKFRSFKMVQIEGIANLVKQFEGDFKVIIERAPSTRNWSKGLFCTLRHTSTVLASRDTLALHKELHKMG